MEDDGRARVSMNFSIGHNISIDFDDTWSGYRLTKIPGLSARHTNCFAFVYVYRSGLNADYYSKFVLNGILIAEAHGNLDVGVNHDGGNVVIPMIIV
jgi:hypothetical protein